jgi:hypothetical protein
MSADPSVFSSGASQDNVSPPTLGAGRFGCEAAGGSESVDVTAATDADEAADDDETPTLPHAASATVTTSVAVQRMATINRSIFVMKLLIVLTNACTQTRRRL